MRLRSSSPGRPIAAAAWALSCLAVPAVAQQAAPAPATTLESLTVESTIAPIPVVGAGAPLLTPAEIHEKGEEARVQREAFERGRSVLYQCYMTVFGVAPQPDRMMGYDAGAEAARTMSNWSRLAEVAAVALEQARLDMAAGRITRADFEKAELERQKAVNEMVKAEADYEEARAETIDLQQLVKQRSNPFSWRADILANMSDRQDRRAGRVPKEFENLAFESMHAEEMKTLQGAGVVVVTGLIRNHRTTRVSTPPLSITAVDQFGKALKVDRAQSRAGLIDPGKTLRFSYTLEPSPPNTAKVTVAFGQLGTQPALEPVESDPVCQYHPSVPYDVKGSEMMDGGAPVPNTLAELDQPFAEATGRSPSGVAPPDIAFLDPRTITTNHAAPSGRVNLLPEPTPDRTGNRSNMQGMLRGR